ncbi:MULTISPECIES: efflux RND transporter periplasmic adaptor subunit [Fischerella]|uniref:Efflux RND transporter periplasmic adaptor subunit n=1 Tax=Fischerella muscicola CCMEE 5323 TaxID=2019572 RepID=A0A2N6K0L4_FISMU|nr:efflux RND transporter periplasmic adaptor subunit [Fischerella muscicola]MBD2435017.1 efflux RND transporter periplasmic adaptor subunit [Fischerella sp. FACHB-380]PLZ87689.1 efflux RND transporter periplasmic adaptor subunit [Fischerella muscicola CCMEE 5323]
MGEESYSELGTEQPVTIEDADWEGKKLKRRSPWLLPLLLGTGLGVAIAFVGMGVVSNRQTPSKNAVTKSTQQVAPTMTVTVVSAEANNIARTLSTTGTVAARDLIPVLPQTNGLQIKQVLVNEGDTVKGGQLLAVLDDSLLQAQISQAKADIESRQADVASNQANLEAKKADVASFQAVVQQKRADLAQAKAKLEEAQRNYQRYQQLANDGAISKQELETRETTLKTAKEAVRVAEENVRSAQADVSSAQANINSAQAGINSAQANVKSNAAKLQQLKTQLAQTLVRAPVSGTIAEKLARVGDVTGVPPQTQVGNVVGGTQKLFSIIREGKLELQAEVPTVQLPQVKVGAAVEITSDADKRVRLQGQVREIEPIVNDQSRKATVKIDLPPTNLLKPGMFARAAVTTNTTTGVVVPQKAVLPQPDGSAIAFTLLGEDTVRAQKVELGEILNGGKVEIKTGLQTGDRVVVDGAGYLKDGDKVRVVGG